MAGGDLDLVFGRDPDLNVAKIVVAVIQWSNDLHHPAGRVQAGDRGRDSLNRLSGEGLADRQIRSAANTACHSFC